MAKRLIGMVVLSAFSIAMLAGCDNSADPTNTNSEVAKQDAATEVASAPAAPVTNTIDWQAVASGETPAELANYEYPFPLDSESVRSYADYFKVDSAVAQHNITIGMASNEGLSKVLDQLDSSYTSHELTDGENIELIIHTTSDIKASSYDYVLAEDFAKGLILPIVIKPDSKKSDLKPHGESPE
ncbi:hypothetical protein RCH20_000991 [Psychrobacter sp. PL15]|uniref:hypothetical protein n=1 Tax=unclassified Psychrobacter TaxID=196806 RepID=UPI001AE27135|nr:hypothetical protein [Psychrobacter sp. PL15]MEC5209933.1 hypothetical protein [Psychrobacter sp. PL15]